MLTAYLLDRFTKEDGTLMIRAQTETGAIVEVRVDPNMRERAAAIPGRGVVRYKYQGGHAVFTGCILPAHADTSGWKARHLAALDCPTSPIVQAMRAWIEYAEQHQARFESPIGEDYVLGLAWARWGAALRALLNGDCGRLDCGTLDAILCRNLEEQGYQPEDL